MSDTNQAENHPLSRRSFVQRAALAGGGLTLVGPTACGPAEAGTSAPSTEFELYHEVYGEGPAIVFAHGGSGTHMSWWRQIPTFSREFTCITYAQLGFGFSTDVENGPGRAAFAEDLRSLLDELEIETACLVGPDGVLEALACALRVRACDLHKVEATLGPSAACVASYELTEMVSGDLVETPWVPS